MKVFLDYLKGKPIEYIIDELENSDKDILYILDNLKKHNIPYSNFYKKEDIIERIKKINNISITNIIRNISDYDINISDIFTKNNLKKYKAIELIYIGIVSGYYDIIPRNKKVKYITVII